MKAKGTFCENKYSSSATIYLNCYIKKNIMKSNFGMSWYTGSKIYILGDVCKAGVYGRKEWTRKSGANRDSSA